MRRFTNSELRTFKRCKRKWWLGHYSRLSRARTSPVSASGLGTLVHLGIEVYYRYLDEDLARSAMTTQSALDAAAWQEAIEADPFAGSLEHELERVEKQIDLALIMVEGYFEWLAETGADFGITTVGVEQHVEIPLAPLLADDPVWLERVGEDATLLGKLDRRILREFDGAVLIEDTKTVANFADRTRLAPQDEQLLHYHLMDHLAHLSGLIDAPRVDGAVLNMLRKVKRTKAAKPPFYAREEVRHNVHELRSYWIRVLAEIADIRESERRLEAGEDHRSVAYPNPTRDCAWDCDFRPICKQYDDGGDPESVIRFAYVERNPLERYEDDVEASEE